MWSKSNLLGVLAVTIGLLGIQLAAPTAHANVRHFAVLCKLQSLAKTPLEKFEFLDFKPNEIYQIANRIFVSFGGKSGGEKKKKEGEANVTRDEDQGIPLDDVIRQAEDKEKNVEINTSPELRQAALILKEVKDIKTKAEEIQGQIEEKETEIRKDLAAALFGSAWIGKDPGGPSVDYETPDAVSKIALTGNTQATDIIGANAAASCGGTTGPGTVAPSLISDFYCVCVGGNGSGSGAATGSCANGIATNGNTWGQVQSHTDLQAGWKHISGICDKVTNTTKLSPHAIDAALADFFALIGYQTNSQPTSNYIFGTTSNGSTGCTGADADLCVNYKHWLETSDKQIPWVAKFRDAEDKLRQRAELIQKLKLDWRRLEHRAFAAQMIQKPLAATDRPIQTGQPAGTSPARGTQQGSQNSVITSDPAAALAFPPPTIHRFFLPWTLLI